MQCTHELEIRFPTWMGIEPWHIPECQGSSPIQVGNLNTIHLLKLRLPCKVTKVSFIDFI